jgi:hypothetical protein
VPLLRNLIAALSRRGEGKQNRHGGRLFAILLPLLQSRLLLDRRADSDVGGIVDDCQISAPAKSFVLFRCDFD